MKPVNGNTLFWVQYMNAFSGSLQPIIDDHKSIKYSHIKVHIPKRTKKQKNKRYNNHKVYVHSSEKTD